MRLAVRSGARDPLVEPLNTEEFIAVLERLRLEPRRAPHQAANAEVTVVMGAAGGVGTSMVACNLAHALATEAGMQTLLVDLDVNAAPLASFLDLKPERGLPAALAEVESLDQHDLQGYVTRHRSGLHLMGAPSKDPVFARDLDANRITSLMGVENVKKLFKENRELASQLDSEIRAKVGLPEEKASAGKSAAK